MHFEETQQEIEPTADQSMIVISKKITIPKAEWESFDTNDDVDLDVNKTIVDKERGIIKSNRTWGVELECVAGNHMGFIYGINKLPELWGAKDDGSIRGGYAKELVTCPMSGKKAEDIFTETCTMLTDADWTVNESCGTHVHIGIPEAKRKSKITEARMKRLAIFYTVFEPAIRCLLPKERRSNGFCTPMNNTIVQISDTKHELVAESKTEKRFDNLYFKKRGYHTPRDMEHAKREHRFGYSGINFQSIYFRGTLEIRYHEGTLDPVRLIHWIALHSAIIDTLMSGCMSEKEIMRYAKIKDVTKLFHRLMSILNSRMDKSTRTYTEERFETFKQYNPADGYIPQYRQRVIEVVVADKQQEEDIREFIRESQDDEY